MTSTVGVRSIAAHKAAAAALQEGTPERAIADLQVAELEYLRRVQWAAANISAKCSQEQVVVGGVHNNERPYLSWSCCGPHRFLKAEKERLLARAKELGVELALDAQAPIVN